MGVGNRFKFKERNPDVAATTLGWETKMRVRRFVLAALVAAMLGGCGAGPWSPANAWNNYPPRVRSVAWIVPASCVVVAYQPYDATDVEVDGWCVRAGHDFNNSNEARVHTYWNLREALDTVNGRGYFLLVDEDWSNWWDEGQPVLSSMDSYLLISVHDPDGQRVGVSLWKLAAGGGVSQVSRATTPALVGEITLPTTEWRAADRAFIAQQLAIKK